MSLHEALRQREAAGRPVRVGVVGAGTFGRMYLAQAQRTAGVQIVAVADRDVQRVRDGLTETGWPAERFAAHDVRDALRHGTTFVTDDVDDVLAAELDVLVEATGNPAVGIRHALRAFDRGFHVVMVNVEADALAGPLLAQRAAAAGVVYSLAGGDQPALICELVDWARTCGFDVVAAGKGTRFLPEYLASTPDTVWPLYDMDPDHARSSGFNAQMFNSFLDGTKSAIEMAAVSNATGLEAPDGGLRFPPAGADQRAAALADRAGGPGQVEVVSSLHRDGSPVDRDLRWGVYVAFAAADDYVAQRFADYGVVTDPTGRIAALYRPMHLIGLELGTSVASVALRGEPTGAPRAFRSDVAAVAKTRLEPGRRLDGEGGFCVRGQLASAEQSLRLGALPIGLAHDLELLRPVEAGQVVSWDDVAFDPEDPAVRFRREMERAATAVA